MIGWLVINVVFFFQGSCSEAVEESSISAQTDKLENLNCNDYC